LVAIAGWVVDKTGSYSAVLWAVALAPAAASGLVVTLRRYPGDSGHLMSLRRRRAF
jgi:hypothetical protein